MRKTLLFGSLLITFLLVGCNKGINPDKPNPPVVPVVYQTASVDICQDEVKNYLLAETEQEQFKALYDHSVVHPFEYRDTPVLPIVSFNESNNLPYSFIYTDDNWNTINNEIITTNSYTFTNPVPGYSYQWEVVDSKNILCGHGIVNIKDDVSVRYMKIDGATNARDLGGWIGEDGHQVQYNLLYRGGQLNGNNTLSNKGLDFIRNTMSIKTEIDFRYDADDLGQKVTAIGEKTFGGYDVAYIRDLVNSFQSYDGFYKNQPTRALINQIITAMSDINNYPMYFHCIAGADRTGSFAFMINGLLGVSEEDLIRDFELTSFSPHGPRWRAGENESHTGFDYSKTKDGYKFQEMIKELKKYAPVGSSIQQCVTNFLLKPNDSTGTGGCGLDMETLNKVKIILLGLDRDYIDPRNIVETCENAGVAVYHLSGNDIVINTEKLGHDYEVADDYAFCSRCSAYCQAIDLEVSCKDGYNFGSDKVHAVFTNGKELPLVNGFASFDNTLAYDKKVGLIVSDTNGFEIFYNLSIYSMFISSEDDLKNMNNFEYEFKLFTGETKTYGYFKLEEDITLTTNWNKDYALGLLCDKSSYGGFNGLFDGCGHTISNFNCIGQDSALVYAMGKEGIIKNLFISGSTLDAYWGSDFITAYSYGGTYENLYIEVELGSGDLTYNNTALLGTIGFNDDLINTIEMLNVDIECKNIGAVDCSCALGQVFFSSQCEGKINNNIKIENVRLHSFTNLLIYGSSKTATYSIAKTANELITAIGTKNINNLLVD